MKQLKVKEANGWWKEEKQKLAVWIPQGIWPPCHHEGQLVIKTSHLDKFVNSPSVK